MTKPPAVGDPAPDFTLPSTQGPITLSERLRQGAALLVFYPADGSPVCVRQLCGYRDNPQVFADAGVQVLAINPQSEASHGAFSHQHGLPFPVLTDGGGRVCRQYGALGLLGTAKRALVLVGSDRKVLWRRTDLPLLHQSAADLRRVLARIGL